MEKDPQSSIHASEETTKIPLLHEYVRDKSAAGGFDHNGSSCWCQVD